MSIFKKNENPNRTINFEYWIDYDYRTHYDCDSHGCNDEGICRCSEINDVELQRVILSNNTGTFGRRETFASGIYNHFYPPREMTDSKKRDKKISNLLYGNLDQYCIDRIMRHYKLYDINLYEEEVKAGYYGEEFEGIFLIDNELEQKFKKDCGTVLSYKTIGDKLRFLLELEYDEVLDDLIYADFDSILISKDDIDFTRVNKNHIDNVKNKGKLDYYSDDNYLLPRGIVRRHDDKYVIIDGYHRIINAEKQFNVFCVK